MKIRIYETDFEGNPVECTGDFFPEQRLWILSMR